MTDMTTFPEIKMPVVLSEQDCAAVVDTCREWIIGQLREAGGVPLAQKYVDTVNKLEVLKALPTEDKAALHVVHAPECVLVHKQLSELEPILMDFPPFKALLADYNFMRAETADAILRTLKGDNKPDELSREAADKIVGFLAGLDSLVDVANCYQMAADLSWNAISQVIQVVQSGEKTDLRLSLTAAWNSWAICHLNALNRAALVWLSTLCTQKITKATLDEVLPQAILQPTAYADTIMPERMHSGLVVINYFMEQAFNDVGSAINFMNAVGNLAMIMREYDVAEQAFKVAKQACDPDSIPDVLINNIALPQLLRQHND